MANQKKESSFDKNKYAINVMPNSLEAEQAVLGAIISDNEIAVKIVCDLSESDFYASVHQTIFKQIQYLMSKNQPVDIVMLSNSLQREDKLQSIGGVTMLAGLVESIPSTANCDYYVTILKRKSLIRNVIRKCNQIIANAYEEEDAEKVLAVAEALIFNISEHTDSEGLQHISQTAVEVLNKLAEVYNNGGESTEGLRVGFSNLDEKTNGFTGGQLIVLAARPGCGKTSFAMNIVSNIARKNKEKVLAVFNLEMSSQELVQRLIANLSGVDSQKMQKGEQKPEDLDKMWKAASVLNDSNVYIDDSSLISADQILSKCRRLKAQKGALDLVVVDYLQLMECSSVDRMASKQQQVSNTSRAMKILAKELKVPVILLSQMSRSIEQRDVKEPMLSDLRESGAIEQDADMVFFLTEGDFEVFSQESTPIYLKIAKHRNGSTGELGFKWEKNTMVFTPVEKIIIKPKEEDANNQNAPNKDMKKAQFTPQQGNQPVGGAVNNNESATGYSPEFAPIDVIPEPPQGDSFAFDPLAELNAGEIDTKPKDIE